MEEIGDDQWRELLTCWYTAFGSGWVRATQLREALIADNPDALDFLVEGYNSVKFGTFIQANADRPLGGFTILCQRAPGNQSNRYRVVPNGHPIHKPISRSALVWLCGTCETPVDDGKGYVGVSHKDLGAHDRQTATYTAWERAEIERTPEFPFIPTNWSLVPKLVRWKVRHTSCDPDAGYAMRVGDVRTPRQLLGVTAHLLESKRWIQSTDWNSIIRNALGEDTR